LQDKETLQHKLIAVALMIFQFFFLDIDPNNLL